MKSIADLIEIMIGEVGQCLRSVSRAQLDAAVEEIDKVPRLFIAGAGRSGLAMRAFAMRLMHLGKTVHVVGDVTTPSIQEQDLLVIGSGSGSTGSLRVQAERAKSIGARILLFTIASNSPIGSIADVVVSIAAPSPKAGAAAGVVESVQPMGSLFEQSLFLLSDVLILALMQHRQRNSEEMFQRHANLE